MHPARCRHREPNARVDAVGQVWSMEPTSLDELDDAIAELSALVSLLYDQRNNRQVPASGGAESG